MSIHPELAQLVAQAEIEAARSRTQQVPALRADLLERRAAVISAAACQDLVPTGTVIQRWRARRAGLRATVRPTNG